METASAQHRRQWGAPPQTTMIPSSTIKPAKSQNTSGFVDSSFFTPQHQQPPPTQQQQTSVVEQRRVGDVGPSGVATTTIAAPQQQENYPSAAPLRSPTANTTAANPGVGSAAGVGEFRFSDYFPDARSPSELGVGSSVAGPQQVAHQPQQQQYQVTHNNSSYIPSSGQQGQHYDPAISMRNTLPNSDNESNLLPNRNPVDNRMHSQQQQQLQSSLSVSVHQPQDNQAHQQQQQQQHVPFRTSTDSFALPDLDVTIGQLSKIQEAAIEANTIQTEMTRAFTRINKAVSQQHQDSAGLLQQHQRLAARVDTVWKVSAEAREDVSNMKLGFQQHIQSFNDVSETLIRRADSQERMIHFLVARLQRTTRLSMMSSVKTLQRKNECEIFSRCYAAWIRYTLKRTKCRKLLNRTLGRKLQRRLVLWMKFSQKAAARRACTALMKQNTVSFRRLIWVRWQRHVKAKTILNRKLRRMHFGSDQQRLRVAFNSWFGDFLKARQKLRRQQRMTLTLSFINEKALLHRYYNQLLLRVQHRKKNRRTLTLQRHLLGLSNLKMSRVYFAKWFKAHQTRFKQRKQLVWIHDSNLKLLGQRFFRAWYKAYWQKWVLRNLAAQVNDVNYKVEIGLRTATNTSDTIQQLLGHYQQLEDKMVSLSRSKVNHNELKVTAYKTSMDPLAEGLTPSTEGATASSKPAVVAGSFDNVHQVLPKPSSATPREGSYNPAGASVPLHHQLRSSSRSTSANHQHVSFEDEDRGSAGLSAPHRPAGGVPLYEGTPGSSSGGLGGVPHTLGAQHQQPDHPQYVSIRDRLRKVAEDGHPH